jgi:hypothetical protein
MASLVNFGRIGRGLFLLVLGGVIAGCGGSSGTGPASSTLDPTTVQATADGVSAQVITADFLPNITPDDIETIEGPDGTSYRHVFAAREFTEGATFAIEARWDPVDGGLQPSLTWILDGEASQDGTLPFVLDIPKSFAATVDDITFDPDPDEIIDADPVVQFNIDVARQYRKNIRLISDVLITTADPAEAILAIASKLDDLRVFSQFTACGKWTTPERMKTCYLSVVALNPGAFDNSSCAHLAVRTGDTGSEQATAAFEKACDTIRTFATQDPKTVCEDTSDPAIKVACKGLVWNVFEGPCWSLTSTEREICIYEAAVAANDSRYCNFLHLLAGADMANDCRATLTMDPSYCTVTNDAARRASCCETFRGTDDFDTCLGTPDATTTTVTEDTTTTVDENTTTTAASEETTTSEPGEEDLPPAIPAGVYTGTFDQRILVDIIAQDVGKPDINTIAITVDDDGLISGDLAVHQQGLFMGCTGAESDWSGTIDSGQIIGPTLPYTVTVTLHVVEADPFDAGTWDNAQCVWPPVVTTEQSSLPLEFETIQDGLLTGLAGDYVPFELQLVP